MRQTQTEGHSIKQKACDLPQCLGPEKGVTVLDGKDHWTLDPPVTLEGQSATV